MRSDNNDLHLIDGLVDQGSKTCKINLSLTLPGLRYKIQETDGVKSVLSTNLINANYTCIVAYLLST